MGQRVSSWFHFGGYRASASNRRPSGSGWSVSCLERATGRRNKTKDGGGIEGETKEPGDALNEMSTETAVLI